MGGGTRITTPRLWDRVDRARISPASSWMSAEARFSNTDPRFLVSVFLRDCPGVLRQVARILDDGFPLSARLPARGEPVRVRFSLDGSMASSVGSAFVIAVVVRPVEPELLSATAPDFVKHRLEQALVDGLANFHCAREFDPKPKVKAFDFTALDDLLFVDRRFTEYRFGLPSDSPSLHPELAHVAAHVTRRLGEAAVPVAYLYFPDRWRDRTPDIAWLRIGIGAPQRLVDAVELDLAANEFAEVHRTVFEKYDPFVHQQSMSERFHRLGDYRSSMSSLEPALTSESHWDVVYAEGPARSGYIADMLSDKNLVPVAGSTTVLAGHTIGCWLMPEGSGEALAEHIREIDPQAIEAELARVVVDQVESGSFASNSARSLWLAWKGPDQPGMLRTLLDALVSYVEDHAGSVTDVDIKYAVSRVLASGMTCAGKLNFMMTEHLADAILEEQDDLRSALLSALRRRPGNAVESNSEVIVMDDEPGEEPWASLLVEN